MRMLFVADLHYTLRQFDWLTGNAGDYDPVMIGGDTAGIICTVGAVAFGLLIGSLFLI